MNLIVSLLLVLLAVVHLNASSSYPEHDHEQDRHDEETDESWEGATTLTLPTISDDLPLGEFLSNSYYHGSCPDLEGIISRKVKQWLKKDYSLAAGLIRLHFHDCAIRGCDASILLNHEGGEREGLASKTLRGFEVIDDIKAEVEKKCPRTVSCADILTAATRDATVQVGGPYWAVPYGRKDGKVSIAKETEKVPMGHEDLTSLLEIFQSQGLNVLDLVVLSGALTIGRSSCESVQHRLFNFSGTGKPDPSLDARYLSYLERKCRWASDYADLDAVTPHKFDAAYYINLQKKMGLLSTDQMLYSDPRTKSLVSAFASLPSVFYQQFGVSMAKLGNVQVHTGQNEGEIRTNCNFVNSY
ncbi:peroxidase 7-like [Malus sylvestris]|uniref:peroxidase 7-like n=1 Tax=Malus sylvestris TaxID=3752 RepID=UPI0021AB9AC3|nr:peroxidase 7-like [Malus sylvestris]